MEDGNSYCSGVSGGAHTGQGRGKKSFFFFFKYSGISLILCFSLFLDKCLSFMGPSFPHLSNGGLGRALESSFRLFP